MELMTGTCFLGLLLLTVIYCIFLFLYHNIAKYKIDYFKKFENVASRINCKVIKDNTNIFQWPIIIGNYKNRKITVRTIEKGKIDNKTAISINFQKRFPTIVLVFNNFLENEIDSNDSFSNYKIEPYENDLYIGYKSPTVLKDIFNNDLIKNQINKLNNDNNFCLLLFGYNSTKFFTKKWIEDEDLILRKMNIIMDLSIEIENKMISKSLKENKEEKEDMMLIDNTEFVFNFEEKLKDPGYIIGGPFCLIGFLLILTGVVYQYANSITDNSSKMIIISVQVIWVGIIFLLGGFTMYYYWRKYKFTIFNG